MPPSLRKLYYLGNQYLLARKSVFTLPALPFFNPLDNSWQLRHLRHLSAVLIPRMIRQAGLPRKVSPTGRTDERPFEGMLPQVLA